jgi:urea transport system substrate-binding protein
LPASDLFLFVSHVSEDRAAALQIVAELEKRGVPCWIAPRNVRPGRPFDDEIADAIDGARAMLLIFSNRCNDSEYIRREVTVAGESGKVIIPFRIEDAQPKRGLRVRLSDLHWIDAFVERERAIDELVHSVLPAEGDQGPVRPVPGDDPSTQSAHAEKLPIEQGGSDRPPADEHLGQSSPAPASVPAAEPRSVAPAPAVEAAQPLADPAAGMDVSASREPNAEAEKPPSPPGDIGATDRRPSRRAMLIAGGTVTALGAAGWAVMSSLSRFPDPDAPPAKPPDTTSPGTDKPSAAPATRGSIRVGILHSLSGPVSDREAALSDLMVMLIKGQNAKGGLLGRKLEAVIVDPASNWPLFAEKARELIAKDKVAAVFGCWTSISRKSVLPVFKELNNILFYPAQHEGEESERNVFYTGATPNQQAIPAVSYLAREEKVTRWVLAGTDYVYPRTVNKILEAYLRQKGVADADIMIDYKPIGHSDWRAIVSDIKRFGSAGKKTAVVSTLYGDSNPLFYRELGNQRIKPLDIPVMALSVGEEELAGWDTRPFVGSLAAANYFQSIKSPLNDAFIADWRAFTGNPKRVTSDPMEAHFISFGMWVRAVEKAQSIDPDRVIDALPGIEAPNLTGGMSSMLPNHHITKPAYVGEVRADGQLDVVWKTTGLIPGDAWSDYLPGSKDLEADWVTLKCGNYNKATKTCGDTP